MTDEDIVWDVEPDSLVGVYEAAWRSVFPVVTTEGEDD